MDKPAQTGSEKFLDMQAEIGITKHIGGFAATDELLALCRAESAREILNVGCGIGVGSVYIAKKFSCRVVGVDLSEKMVAWSRQRAREEGVADRVEFQNANLLDLPFETGRFDLVFAESVLIFVEDKARAIAECVRVTKPGGYVGFNEGFWFELPPPELIDQVRQAVGPYVPTLEAWQALWDVSGLSERVIQTHPVDAAAELKARVEWIGRRWLLRAWGRGLRLIVTRPGVRKAISEMFAVPPEATRRLGYAIMTGKK